METIIIVVAIYRSRQVLLYQGWFIHVMYTQGQNEWCIPILYRSMYLTKHFGNSNSRLSQIRTCSITNLSTKDMHSLLEVPQYLLP